MNILLILNIIKNAAYMLPKESGSVGMKPEILKKIYLLPRKYFFCSVTHFFYAS